MNDDSVIDAPSDAEWQPVRAALRDVDVPADARESALAAALAAFDDVQGDTAAPAAPAPVVQLADRRGGPQRWLRGAAAVVAVLAVGSVVMNRLGSFRDDNEVSVPALAPATAEQSTNADASTERGVEAATSTDTAALPAAGVLAATPTTTVAPSTAAEADTPFGEAPPSTIGSIDGAASTGPTVVVDSPEALAEYARTTRLATGGGESATPAPACLPPNGEMLGSVMYRQQQAVVIVDRATGEVAALDRLSCAVLATVMP